MLKDRPDHAESPGGNAAAASCKAAAPSLLRLFPFLELWLWSRRLTRGNVGLHFLQIVYGQLTHPPLADERLDVRFDPAPIHGEGGGLDWPPPSTQKTAGLRLLQIPIADLRNRHPRPAVTLLVSYRVASADGSPQDLSRQLFGLIKGERAVSTDRVLARRAVASAASAIAGDECLAPTGPNPQAKAGQSGIPDDVSTVFGRRCVHYTLAEFQHPPELSHGPVPRIWSPHGHHQKCKVRIPPGTPRAQAFSNSL